MSAHWDPTQDHDSQTFSEDYNLHGASNRSLEHPSITRDDHFHAMHLELNNDDHVGLDEVHLNLIASIIDGKALQQNPRQRTPLQRIVRQDEDYSGNNRTKNGISF
jgi:hypothetical protein